MSDIDNTGQDDADTDAEVTADEDDGYQVGYGKPPRHSQFKKGGAGNPGRRKKATPSLNQVVSEALNEQVVVTQGGKRYTISKLRAALTQTVNQAASGDLRATKVLLELARHVDQEAALADVLSSAVAAQVVMIELPSNGR